MSLPDFGARRGKRKREVRCRPVPPYLHKPSGVCAARASFYTTITNGHGVSCYAVPIPRVKVEVVISHGVSLKIEGLMSEKAEFIQRRTGINWATTSAMVIFHVCAVAALFTFSWTAVVVDRRAVVDFGEPRRRHGLSPPADAPRVQDAEVGRVLPDVLRDARARRRRHRLGRHAPHTPRAHRRARRPAHAARRHAGGRTWAGF